MLNEETKVQGLFSLTATVLEYKENSFQGNDGNLVTYNTALLRYDGVVFRVTSQIDLSKVIDKNVHARFQIMPGRNMNAKIRLLELAE